MVVTHLVAGTPDRASAGGDGVVVEHGAQCAVAVVGTIGGGVHVAVIHREGVPDVAETTLQILLEAHEVLLAIHKLAPYTYQTFHLVVALGHCLLHQVVAHDVYHTLTLQVDDVVLVQQLLAQQHPVLVGHTACEVEVALQLTALDVDLHVGIVGQVLLRIIELIEDVYGAGLVHDDCVESGMQVCGGTCLAVTGRLAVLHHLYLQSAVGAGLFIQIDVDDITCLAHDACGAGELAEGVAHTGVFVPRHLLVVAIYLVVVAHTEELLEAAAVAIGTLIYLPGVVLHLLHHCLDSLRQTGVIGIGLQLLVGECLDFLLQSGAGFVLEQVGQCGVVGADVGYQVLEGVQLLATLLDELVGELHFLESPCAAGQTFGVPSYHIGALVAVQAHSAVIHDIICKVGVVSCTLAGETLSGLGFLCGVLAAEGTSLAHHIALCAHVLQGKTAAYLHQRPVLGQLVLVETFATQAV